MADPELETDVFAIPSLWRTSNWHDQIATQSTASFFSHELPSLDSKLQQTSAHNLTLLHVRQPSPSPEGFFKLPSFDSTNDDEHSVEPASRDEQKGRDSNERGSEDTAAKVPVRDVWIDLDAPPAKKPKHKTWDGFLKGSEPDHQPLYITEAGPAVYDALLDWEEDPLFLNNAGIVMVDARAYMGALRAMAVGRESVFFIRSTTSNTFEPALSKVRLSGYSLDVLSGLQKQCVSCGDTFLRLQSFVQSTYTSRPSRCSVALSSALHRILNTLQRYLDIDGRGPRSILELQHTITNIQLVLQPLQEMMLQLDRKNSDEDILSLAFRHACVVEHKESFVRAIMQELLQIVSVPWINFLEEWIGTRPEEGIPFTTADIGKGKGFVKVESETCFDDFGHELEEVDFRMERCKVPDFFPDDVALMAFETGKNLRFIRSAHPSHPLSQLANRRSPHAPQIRWLYDWRLILDLEGKVASYRAALESIVSEPGSGVLGSRLPTGEPPRPRDTASGHIFSLDEPGFQHMIQSSMAQMSAPLTRPMESDELTKIIEKKFSGNRASEAERVFSSPHPSLMPVLSFGGLIAAQAHCVNRESLRLLFEAHDLRNHLNLQKEFQLLGSGVFCSRLSHALFDPDLDTAERQTGVTMDGSVMGLRLGGRDTWPPASSELRLALMGILTDSFVAEHGADSLTLDPSRETTPSMPGDLSFSVRDLSPEEIEKCMQPDGLEALDFLRLAYTTPPALKAVITPLILMQYDRIFKFLLRMLRLSYVVDQLSRNVTSRTSMWHDPSNVSLRFAWEARHFVSSVSEYFMDTGIAQPWQGFQQKLDQVEDELKNTGSEKSSGLLLSPERVQEHHARLMEQIMTGLFLRKRQQAVMKLLEDIFGIILKHAKYSRLRALGRVEENYSTEDAYKNFKKKVQIFITVCRSLTEKSRAKDGASGAGLGNDSMISQLLLKLDINNFYVR